MPNKIQYICVRKHRDNQDKKLSPYFPSLGHKNICYIPANCIYWLYMTKENTHSHAADGYANIRGFDNKTAAYSFLMLMFVIILFSVFIGALNEGGRLDTDNFWVGICLKAIQYALLLGVFVLVCRQSRIGSKAVFEQVWLARPDNGKTAHGDKDRTESGMVLPDDAKKIRLVNVCIVVLLSGLCIAGFILVTAAFGELFKIFGYNESAGGMTMDTAWKYLAAVAVSAILPAIIEELIFRGIILRGFLPLGTGTAVAASAVLFSLFHLSPGQTVFQFVLGVVLALVVLRTGKLVYAMILHFINNFSILTYTYIAGDVTLLLEWNVVTVAITVVLAVVSILFIRELLGKLKTNDNPKIPAKSQKFWNFDNFGYFICVALAGMIWLLAFV